MFKNINSITPWKNGNSLENLEYWGNFPFYNLVNTLQCTISWICRNTSFSTFVFIFFSKKFRWFSMSISCLIYHLSCQLFLKLQLQLKPTTTYFWLTLLWQSRNQETTINAHREIKTSAARQVNNSADA